MGHAATRSASLRTGVKEAVAMFGPNDAKNDPQHADTWDESRTIHAEVIRWLCIDREALHRIDPHGINIDVATIKGHLDLANVTIPVLECPRIMSTDLDDLTCKIIFS